MARPKNSSYQSHFQIYWRLLQGPLWLGDWKSTDLQSRSTVNYRLKYLLQVGLVQKTRQGHKMVYDFSKKSTGSSWESVLKSKSFKKAWDKLAGPGEDYGRYKSLVAKWESEKNDSEIREFARHFAKRQYEWELPDYDFFPLLLQYREGNICCDCLKNEKIEYYITDSSSGEQIWPKCGNVRED